MVTIDELLAFLKTELRQYATGLKRIVDENPDYMRGGMALLIMRANCTAKAQLIEDWLEKSGDIPPLDN